MIVKAGGGAEGRADWLTESAQFVRDNDGVFATYFDSDIGTDYRLHDEASRAAWRAVIQGT